MHAETKFPTRYWHALDDGRVQCDLCPRFCKLREGQRGLCFVRARRGDEILSLAFGIEFSGVIFWMDIWMDLSGNVFWGTGDIYFGNISRAAGTMSGVVFDDSGGVATFTATK